jgi:ribosomal protein L37E
VSWIVGITFGALVLFLLTSSAEFDSWVFEARFLIAGASVALGQMVAKSYFNSRPCPRCGERVQKGVMDCTNCGFDFRTVGEEGGRP